MNSSKGSVEQSRLVEDFVGYGELNGIEVGEYDDQGDKIEKILEC